MMILKMEMKLKELKHLLLIIFALLYFIIFYQVHFKKMFLDMENFIKKDIYINY